MLNKLFSLLIFFSVNKNYIPKRFQYNNLAVLYMSYDLLWN